jgi:hypothetical protein
LAPAGSVKGSSHGAGAATQIASAVLISVGRVTPCAPFPALAAGSRLPALPDFEIGTLPNRGLISLNKKVS